MRPTLPALALLAACAPEGEPPRASAHRGGAGYWPQNSRTAVRGALAAGFDLELDVVLTEDRVPVFSSLPVVDPASCTDRGAPILEPLRWRDLPSERLADLACGGFPDRRFPNALLVAEPPLTLDELLEELVLAPDGARIHLDIGQARGLTEAPRAFAAAVLDRWFAADLPQDLVVSSDEPAVIAAFEGHGRSLGRSVDTALEWPPVDPGDTWSEVLAVDLGRRVLNTLDYVAMVRAAGADGIHVQHELVDLRALAAARREGLRTAVFVVNEPADLRRWTLDRVDVVVTDYPGDLPGPGERP